MTSASGLEISIFEIPLDTTGNQLISQQCGYFHAWRFINANDRSLSLEGEIFATFGGQWNTERIPFTYNSKLRLVVPVDRVFVEWNAQPGRIAQILITRNPEGLDGQNVPARQLVFQGQATDMAGAAATVGTTSAQIVAANSRRSRVIIRAINTNNDMIWIGPAGVNVANGIPLSPGESFVGLSSTAYHAISNTAGQSIRILEELS